MSEYKVNTKVVKINTIIDNHDSRLFIVDSRLGEFVKNTRRKRNLSVDDVQNNSRRGGRKGISSAYVNKIENNPSVNPTSPLLKALADGLGISEEEVFAAARGDNPNDRIIVNERFAAISKSYGELTSEERDVIDPFIIAVEQSLEKTKNLRTKKELTTIIKKPSTEGVKVLKPSQNKKEKSA